MASTLKHLRSSTADKRPTASGLADGQLAINTASGTPGLFFKDSASQVVKVGPVHVGPTPPNDAPAGSSGNSRGELWVDNSLTTPGLNYYSGTAFVNLTPSGTTSTVGLVELATNAETQTGSDGVRAVTPAGLQSKVSDSVSTTSSISIASSTAVKTAYDLAAAALPASGGRVTGTLEIGPSGFIAFEGSSDDSFETFLTAVNPTADRTITFPNITGTLITDADTGTVTNTMLAGSIATTKLANGALPSGVTVNSSNIVDGSIVNADISASAAIAYSKLSLGTSIVDGDISTTAAIAGTKISPNFGSQNIVTTGNVNIDSGTFYVDAVNNRVGVGTTTPATLLDLSSTTTSAKLNLTYPGFGIATLASDSTGALLLQADEANTQANSLIQFKVDGGEKMRLDASGNLGLNGAAADYSGYKNIRINGTDGGILDLSTNGTSVFRITGGTSGVFYYTQNTAYPHVWGAGASERMRLDASGNLGIKNSSPTSYNAAADDLVVGLSGDTGMTIVSGTANQGSIFFADGTTGGAQQAAGYLYYLHNNDSMGFGTANTLRMTLDASGNVNIDSGTFYVDAVNNRVGIGTTGPNSSLHIKESYSSSSIPLRVYASATGSGGGLYDVAHFLSDDATTVRISEYTTGTSSISGELTLSAGDGNVQVIGSTGPLLFKTGVANSTAGYTTTNERMRLDASGNLGLGVVPSAWSNYRALQIGAYLNLSYNAGFSFIGSNAYYNGTNWIYQNTAAATDYYQYNGTHVWRTAPSGTAGAAITFTQAMTLDASGRLGIGTSSPQRTLHVNGTGQIGNTLYPVAQHGILEIGNTSLPSIALRRGTVAANGNVIGSIEAYATESSGLFDNRISAGISFVANGSPSFFQPAHITFSTESNNATSAYAERMRITSGGLVGIGTTSPDASLTIASSSSLANYWIPAGLYSAKIGAVGNSQPNVYAGITGAYQAGDSANFILQARFSDIGTVNGVVLKNSATNAGGLSICSLTAASGGAVETERARIDSSGRLLVGTTSAFPASNIFPQFQVGGTTDGAATALVFNNANTANPPQLIFGKARGGSGGSWVSVLNNDNIGRIDFSGADNAGDINTTSARIECFAEKNFATNDAPGRLVFSTTADGAASPTPRMSISNDGSISTKTAPTSLSTVGTTIFGASSVAPNAVNITRSSGYVLAINRTTDDGNLVEFYQDTTIEGTISVSGTTVSYNGAHLSRWSQLPSDQERTEILRGSVLSNIDEMCEWGEEDNEQLNRMKVSDVEGDKNVAGVFQGWDDDDNTYTNDFYCAMTGDFIIRIGAGVTVERGDLLMSAGDGTAKPQDDDIIRSKTIAKVTSTTVSCTYDDGSYCVPCVLMAC